MTRATIYPKDDIAARLIRAAKLAKEIDLPEARPELLLEAAREIKRLRRLRLRTAIRTIKIVEIDKIAPKKKRRKKK